MCKKFLLLVLVLTLFSIASVASAGPNTVAYWRFEGSTEPNIDFSENAYPAMPDSDARSVWRKGAHDWSGNGNYLTSFEYAWAGEYFDAGDVPGVPQGEPSNAESIHDAGNWPAAMTWSAMSNPPGKDIETITPGAFTVEASFKFDREWGWAHTIVGRDGNSVANDTVNRAPFYFSVRQFGGPGSQTVAIEYTDLSGYTHEAVSAPGIVTTNEWYNMVGVCDGTTLSLYLDDVNDAVFSGGMILVAQSTLDPNSTDTRMAIGLGAAGDNFAGTWTVGRGMWASLHGDRWYGNIDEVRISNTALSPDEFLWVRGDLVHRYSFTDGDATAVDSVGGQYGTLENGASISGNAVHLDGSNDYVNLPGATIAINTFPAITLEMWSTQPTTNQGYSMTASLGGTWPDGNGQDYIMICTARGDDVSRGAIANTPDSDAPWLDEVGVNGPELNDGLEHQYVLTISNTEIAYYIDGDPQGTAPMGGTTISGTSNDYAYLGKGVYTDDATVNCSINEFRIYNSVLTPGEITEHYLNGPDVIGPSPIIVIEESDGSTEVIEGDIAADEYTVALASQPEDDVTLTVDPDDQLDLGSGQGNPIYLYFDDENWSDEQQVDVIAYDDDVLEAEPHNGWIAHTIASNDPDFNNIPLPHVVASISENECGAWGFNYSDLNYDCKANFKDFAIFASYWLWSLNPITLETVVLDWLKTTQPYAAGAQPGPVQDSTEPLVIEPDEIVFEIDEKVYGHFLEHIYHSVSGGLWGELVWNRSFELDSSSGGIWSIEGDELVQSSLATDVHMEFGDTAWEDYEITLEARKDGGSEGFLILFRAPDSDNFYWLNLGGWGNIQHAIEKEVSGGRSVVTSYVSGIINTGQWYDIRIRCEGNNFQVWLDDSPLFDYTDTDNPYMTGEMGVGTWSTQARFRNIEVTEIPGSAVLFSGLPTLPGSEFGAQFWTHFGTSDATMDSDALNDDLSVQIVTTGSGTGLQQDDFKFTQQAYHGSLWMKGSMPAGLSVELLDGETVLGQATLAAPTSSWDEHSFSITPTASTDDGSLRITLQGAGTVNIDQVSMMGQDANAIGGYRPDLLQAIDDLRPPVIRWPGGCFASLYLWKDGIGPQHTRRKYPAYMWDDQDVSSYGTDEFLRMCEILGVEPIIVINTGRTDSACGGTAQFKLPDPCDYLPYALDWMEYCNGDANTTPRGAERAANGHPAPYNVKYWEIDNETWHMGSSTYCDVVNEFAPAMQIKAAELGVPIKIIACGGHRGNMGWNEDVIDNCAENIDYISVHYYESSYYASGPTDYEDDYIIYLGNYIAGSANPDVKIYNSEWNFQSTDWRTGLFAGGILNVYERQGDVFKIGGPALFLRHQSASGWDNAFINFDHTSWFPAPNYVVMKLWHDNYAPYRINMTGSSGNLNAIATKSADGSKIYFKVVNPTDQSVPVKLVISDTFDAGSVSLQLVAPDSLWARNTLENPDTVRAEERYASLNDQTIRFTMPRISAGVVQVSRKE